MHILATFATLCCQTRWPRNHSCTTQEHVSFFRTFSGTRQKPTGQNRTFSEISTFSRFCRFLRICEKYAQICENLFFYVRTCSQKLFYVRATFCKCANVNLTNVQNANLQMCKCANVQKCVVHKMRKSAAQIIFQMQKCEICKCAKMCRASFRQVTFFVVCVEKFCAKYFLINKIIIR